MVHPRARTMRVIFRRALSATWLGHPRLMNRAGRSGGPVSSVTTAVAGSAAAPGGNAGSRSGRPRSTEAKRHCVYGRTVGVAVEVTVEDLMPVARLRQAKARSRGHRSW